MSSRNERRLKKKAFEKEVESAKKSMNNLQRFVLNGLQTGTVSNEDIIEMSKFYVIEELKKRQSADPHSIIDDVITEVGTL